MDIVYIETTVIGNIAGRLHPNANVAARQEITREWWTTASSLYRLVTSLLTLDECADGDRPRQQSVWKWSMQFRFWRNRPMRRCWPAR